MACALAAIAALSAPEGGAAQPAPERTEVVDAIHAFFDAMYERDVDAMRDGLASHARFALLRPTPAGALAIQGYSGEEFIALITDPQTPTLRELIRDPVVQIAGELASVWAPYQVHIDGELSHCGVDAMQLMRMDDGWKLVHLSDNVPTQACGEPWEVPPA